jgi:tetratricopeptide (TPR) repeat protein
VLEADPGNAAATAKLEASGTGTSAARTASPEDARKAQALYERGLQSYLAGDTRKAVEHWEEALNLDPQHTNALNNLVRARLELSGARAPEGDRP